VLDAVDTAARWSRFEQYKAERRRWRAELFGRWAGDDAAWERATGQRWPADPPAGPACTDEPGRSVAAVALRAAGQVAEGA
jgi:hypothetical protein